MPILSISLSLAMAGLNCTSIWLSEEFLDPPLLLNENHCLYKYIDSVSTGAKILTPVAPKD